MGWFQLARPQKLSYIFCYWKNNLCVKLISSLPGVNDFDSEKEAGLLISFLCF